MFNHPGALFIAELASFYTPDYLLSLITSPIYVLLIAEHLECFTAGSNTGMTMIQKDRMTIQQKGYQFKWKNISSL